MATRQRIRRLTARLATAAVILPATCFATLGLSAAPAMAATPQCTQWAYGSGDDAHGFRYVPVSAGGSGDCWMARGDVSGGVWALQRALKYCYGKSIATDSDFGPATQTALRQVQGSLGIGADGKYGPQTRRAILFSTYGNDHYDPAACAHW